MDAYIYQADIYCGPCATAIRMNLDLSGKGPENPRDERTFDSDDYPKGPYANGGGESDAPQYCGNHNCGVFLENPLTKDGESYVRDAVKERGRKFLGEWVNYYSYLFS